MDTETKLQLLDTLASDAWERLVALASGLHYQSAEATKFLDVIERCRRLKGSAFATNVVIIPDHSHYRGDNGLQGPTPWPES